MATRNIETERFSVTSSKPFKAVVEFLRNEVGHPDLAEFVKATRNARTFAEPEGVVNRSLGRAELMMFMEFDLGAVLRKETGRETPKSVRFLIGNPLIMNSRCRLLCSDHDSGG